MAIMVEEGEGAAVAGVEAEGVEETEGGGEGVDHLIGTDVSVTDHHVTGTGIGAETAEMRETEGDHRILMTLTRKI